MPNKPENRTRKYGVFHCMAYVALLLINACSVEKLHPSAQLKTTDANRNIGGKPIYGSDNRLELVHAGRPLCHAARSVPGLLSKHQLSVSGINHWTLNPMPSLSETGWCTDQRFATQPAGIHCSGILIAPDRIATAAHCINAADDQFGPALNCADVAFLFDYRFDANGNLPEQYSSEQVYFCKRILAGEFSVNDGEWRVLELDRQTHRQPLPVLAALPADLEIQHMQVIGHPLGLPLKASVQGRLKSINSDDSFQVSMDTFEGNSGSPVLSYYSNGAVVIGMLVRGETDYLHAENRSCRIVKNCSEKSCEGERVTSSVAFADWSSNYSSDIHELSTAPKEMSLCY